MSDSWYDAARTYIAEIHKSLPADTTFADRKRAVRDGYPWGERKRWPYKAWLRAQREYLARHMPNEVKDERLASIPKTPLEQMIDKARYTEKSGEADDRA